MACNEKNIETKTGILTSMAKEMTWLWQTWKDVKEIPSSVFERIAERLVTLENTLALQDKAMEISLNEIRLAEERMRRGLFSRKELKVGKVDGKTPVGFHADDPLCQKCEGFGNQLFMCPYCEGYDHFDNKDRKKGSDKIKLKEEKMTRKFIKAKWK